MDDGSSALNREFRTGMVSRGDLLEWRLLLTTRRGVAGAFRTLAKHEPDRALAILHRDGRCFRRCIASGEPPRVSVPHEALDVLLTHEDQQVRERTISLLSSAAVG